MSAAATGVPLRRAVLTAFTLPTLVLGFMHGPEGAIQGIYAKHAGLALGALAAAMLLTRIFDAVTYPLIGYLSDRSFARRGTRRHWIIAGTLFSVAGMWFQLRPPPGVGIVYFGAWTAVTYLGWKLMEIPLQAWSYGLSRDYAQRARIQAWRGLAQMLGQLLFFCTPYLAMSLGLSDSAELDFRALAVAAVLCGIALPVATAIAIARVPAGESVPSSRPGGQRYSLAQTLRAVRSNGPLLRLLAAFLPVNILAGMTNGAMFFFIDSYLQLGKHYAAIMLLALPASLIGIPFWSWLAMRYERHRVWAISLLIGAVACAGLSLATPGPSALPLAMALYPAILFSLIGAVIVMSMSADVADYGLLQTGEDPSGLYAGLFSLLQKSLIGASAAFGIALLGWFGFDAAASTQTASGALGIRLVAGIIPAIGLAGAATIIWSYPLNRARLAEIRAELAARS